MVDPVVLFGPTLGLERERGCTAVLRFSEDLPLVYLRSREGLPPFRECRELSHSTPGTMRCACAQMGPDEAPDAAARPTGLNDAFSKKYST